MSKTPTIRDLQNEHPTPRSPLPNMVAGEVGGMGNWQPIATAPKNSTWVFVKMKSGKIQKAHWASDLSGEDQPPFEGWFVKPFPDATYFWGIDTPEFWQPKRKDKPK